MSNKTGKKRRAQPRPTARASVRPEPPATARPAAGTWRAPAEEFLPPWERGPVRAYLRDAVDRRRPRLVLLFMPAFALALIAGFGPQSELGRILLACALVALVVVAVDALLLGVTITREARTIFGKGQVRNPGTVWYVFMRAHRPRSMRRPPPQVRPCPNRV